MSIKAMKQALEVLEFDSFYATGKQDAIDSLRQAIAEASANGLYREGYKNGYEFGEAAGKHSVEIEQEKYAMDIQCTKCGATQSGILTITHPNLKNEWITLTKQEIFKVASKNNPLDGVLTFARAIEYELKEKNSCNS